MTKARLFIATIYLLLLGAPLAAQDEPRFLIERIDIRNAARVSPEIVIAESRLDTNRSYSEQELREAADRLTRLPFLLDAQFSLEKGSVRDAYVLVITVTETKAFFFLLDGISYYDSNAGSNIGFESDQGAVVGMRFFVGRKGAVHFGLDNEEAGLDRPYSDNRNHVQVGYTRYDLFGTRAFATVNLRYPLPSAEDETGRLRPSVLVGVPLTATQTLTAGFTSYAVDREDDFPFFSGGNRPIAEKVATLRWAYDTTNDPFFPTDGMRFTAGPVRSWGDATGRSIRISSDPKQPPVIDFYALHRTTQALELGAAKYWSLSDRNSVSLAADFGYADSEYRSTFDPLIDEQQNTYGTANLGVSHSFWAAAERSANAGDNRVEMNLRYSRESSDDLNLQYGSAMRANVAWVRRSAWGTARVGVGYAW